MIAFPKSMDPVAFEMAGTDMADRSDAEEAQTHRYSPPDESSDPEASPPSEGSVSGVSGTFRIPMLIAPVTAESDRDREQLRQRFDQLAAQWREDCKYSSFLTERAMHPAYQQIIGMGRGALPLIFEDLQRGPDHWFWALRAITGEDPVPPNSKGKLPEMTAAWLTWAREKQYV
jgi:hypothetical protein